ncbi:unnamed protein product, partial [Nesidiocoris tenuis]
VVEIHGKTIECNRTTNNINISIPTSVCPSLALEVLLSVHAPERTCWTGHYAQKIDDNGGRK